MFRLWSVNGVITVSFIVTLVVGTIGNLWVIVLLRHRRIRKCLPSRRVSITQRSRVYIALLTVCNLFLLFTIPFLVYFITAGTWPFGFWMCKLYTLIENACKLVCPVILTAMALDSYLTVFRPYFSNMRIALPVTGAIFLAIIVPIFPNVYFTTLMRLTYNTSDGTASERLFCYNTIEDKFMPFVVNYMFIFGYVIPIAVMIYCYAALIVGVRKVYLRRMSLTGASMPLQNTPREPRYMLNLKTSVFRIVLFHFGSWTPFWIATFLTTFPSIRIHLNAPWFSILRSVFNLLPFINAAGNWILYALLNQQMMSQLGSRYNFVACLRSRIDRIKRSGSECQQPSSLVKK